MPPLSEGGLVECVLYGCLSGHCTAWIKGRYTLSL